MHITISEYQFIALDAYADRELVKASGFRWNRERKQWETPHVIAVARLRKECKAAGRELPMMEDAEARYHAECERFKNAPKCGRCAGTGQFVTMVVNGRPTGPGGICYRCNGAGTLTARDEERNDNYDRAAFMKACREMMSGEGA